MTFGQIRQLIRLRAIPPNWNMIITKVQFNNASGGWWPVFTANRTAGFTKNTSEEIKSRALEIKIEAGQGTIGEAYFSSMNRTDSGKGPDISVDFLLQGSGQRNGKKEYYNASGSIGISTSEWGWWSRADECYIQYVLNGGGSQKITTKVSFSPSDHSLKEAGLICGWDAKNKQLGLNGSTDDSALNHLAGQVTSGNLLDRQGAAGWSKVTL